MPTYRVTDPESGRTLRLTGESPPTESELDAIFASRASAQETQRPSTIQAETHFGIGDVFPETRRALREPTSMASLTAPGGYPGRIAGSTILDILGLAPKAIDTGINLAKGEAPSNAIRHSLRGNAMTNDKTEPAMRLLTQMLILGPKAKPVVEPLATGTAQAIESARLPDIGRPVRAVGAAFERPKIPATPNEILALPESQVAKLPAMERQAYLSGKSSQAKEALAGQITSDQEALNLKLRQADEAFKSKSLQQQQSLAQKRLQFTQRARKAEQLIRQRETQARGSLPETASQDLERLPESFRALAHDQSEAYKVGVNHALANAEAASGTEITFTRHEVSQALAEKYLQPTTAGTPGITLEDPTEYRLLSDMLSSRQIVNQNEISARSLLNMADDFGKQIGVAAKSGARAYTPQEVASQHMRDILLDLLERKGVDVSLPKAEWAKWVPTRNLGFRLQSPSGPGTLVRILKGQDPVRAKSLQNLEALTGERLDRTTKQMFEQLDYLNQQKVLNQAKQAEFERLMQQEQGVFRGNQLVEKSQLAESGITQKQRLAERGTLAQQAVEESNAARKLRVEQQARHLSNIRKIVYGVAAATGAATAGPKRILNFLMPEH